MSDRKVIALKTQFRSIKIDQKENLDSFVEQFYEEAHGLL